jgi:hypothetical protein
MKILLLLAAALVIAAAGCDSSTKPDPGDQATPIPDSLLYLGQDPPGLTPERFGPPELLANEDWFWHGSPAFSPDGGEMYWCKYHRDGYRLDVQYMQVVDYEWTETRSVAFNTEHGENSPVFSFDGEEVLFVSGRPGGFIHKVSRDGDGWTDPEPVSVPIPGDKVHGWQFSMAEDGTLYFELWPSGGGTPDLYRSDLVDGEYSDPVRLSRVNTAYNEFAPFIHPQEEYIIFVSDRPGGHGMHDLYISFGVEGDYWTDSVNMGPEINSDFEDAAPLVSPDGKYFFFNTAKEEDEGYNPYWVDTGFIGEIKVPLE